MRVLLAMALALLILIPIGLNAQNQKVKSAEFSHFWVKFKTAIAKNDKKQVASMTKFPFPYKVYGEKDLSRTEFITKYDEIFDRTTRLCFSRKKTIPIENNAFYYGYSVFCDSSIYSFEKLDREYKFSDKYPDD
ncbi:MAG: hypothetical protein IPM89_06335 [Candidatus Competibacteraceae bacterium]|nr:MAG: hypothetical protein IPM89_06335 [Candidatus Competibacteraceae bacterium]